MQQKKFRNLDGSRYSEDPNRTVTFTSGDNKYVIKDKYTDGIRTSSKERRTLKGFLTGAPKAAGKTPLDEKGNAIKKNGGMIKRADGSYSKRGLWDNIRANKGSGKKPTAAMLKQEKKIKAQSKKKK